MHELSVAAKEDGPGFTKASQHLAIKSLHVRKVELKQSWSLPPRSCISYIIMQSTKYLASVDPERTMLPDDDQHTEEVLVSMAKFDRMMENPAMYEVHNPDLTLEGIVELHEPFYLLKPLEERWGRWVMLKCTCEDFFGAGCCAHSTLLALLYDVSLGFPSDCSFRRLPGRPGRAKKPSAWAEINEEEDGAPAAAPQQLGAADMIIAWKVPRYCL
jgi:hypothetical protein